MSPRSAVTALVWLGLAASAAAEPAPSAVPSATLRLEPDKPEVGAVFHLVVEAHVPDGSVVELPGPSAPLQPFEVLSYSVAQRTAASGSVHEGRYALMAIAPGSYQLGPLKTRVRLPDATEQDLLPGPIPVEVASLLARMQSPPQDILPIKGPLPPPEPARLSPWLAAAAAAFAALLGLGALLVLRRRRQQRAAPAEPAHVTALRRLQELGHRELGAPEAVEPFYVELSSILRRYLERRFALPVMELTTHEIKRAFDPGVHGPNWTFRLYQLLERMDLVKFARFRISSSAAFEDLQTARSLIDELVERDAKAEAERLAGARPATAAPAAPGR